MKYNGCAYLDTVEHTQYKLQSGFTGGCYLAKLSVGCSVISDYSDGKETTFG